VSKEQTNKPLRYRQIHLDFHTSEHIPGVGAAFDADTFVSTLKKAHVDSITVFAKCHHGWSYYPTKVGAPHPNLARPDLLGDMVTALRAFDIIYVMTGGGPIRATETVGYFMYRESMTQFKLGYGAAATVVLLLAVLIVSVPAIIQRTAGAK
jgi:hypothetical protein